jgi:molybdopterin-guanine dinucleotide biosynthesis protein A
MVSGTSHPPAPLGLVLAGGAARRMGGVVKATIPLRGRPLAAWSVAALAPLCRSVALATGDRGALPGLSLPCLPDRVGGAGPVAGLHAGLREAGEAGILVLPCDLPLLRSEHLEPLLLARAGHDLVIYAHERGWEPLVGWYGPGSLPALDALLRAGGGRIRAAYEGLRVGLVPWPFDLALLSNVNSPADLAVVEALLGQKTEG